MKRRYNIQVQCICNSIVYMYVLILGPALTIPGCGYIHHCMIGIKFMCKLFPLTKSGTREPNNVM